MSITFTFTTAARVYQYLEELEQVTHTLKWICCSMKSQLELDDRGFNKFQFIVSKSLLKAAETHANIIANIRITSGHMSMTSGQETRLEQLMRLVVNYEWDMREVEPALRARVYRNAARFPLAGSQ